MLQVQEEGNDIDGYEKGRGAAHNGDRQQGNNQSFENFESSCLP